MKKRRLALVAVGAAVVTLNVGASLAAAQSACRGEADVHVCHVEGFGTILNHDVAQARDEALIDARRRALEQVAGVRVEAETITRNHMLFDQIVRTQARGLIQAERVLEEGQTKDGRLRVKIEAWVKGAEAQERLEALISELSVVVLLPEQNLGQPHAQPLVENEVVSQLVAAGFRVLDHAQVRRVARRDQVAAVERGDEQATRDIGVRFLANLIVIGQAISQPSQNSQGIVSAHARVTARVLEADTGRVVANVSLDEVRGFAASAEVAGRRALGAAGKSAAEQLVQALDGYFKRKERRIEVRLRGLPSLDEYRWAKAFLEKQRWVSGVSEAGYASDQSVIVITYPEKTLYLASRIGREPRYRLLEFDRNRILVEFKR